MIKRIAFLTFLFSLGVVAAVQAQDAQGYLSVRLGESVKITDPTDFCRRQLPGLYEGSTFEVAEVRTDRDGMSHIRLQQYCDGVKADGLQVLLHEQEGRVVSINGRVITASMMEASASGMRHAPMLAADALSRAGICERCLPSAELVLFVAEGQVRRAFKVQMGVRNVWIDALNGEVLRTESCLRHFSDQDAYTPAQGTALTYYVGQQQINFAQAADGQYVLVDPERNICTLNCGFEAMGLEGTMALPDLNSAHGYEEENEVFRYLVNASRNFTNPATEWADTTFYAVLDSLGVEFYGDKWTGLVGQNVFGRLTLSDGTALYTDTVVVQQDQLAVLHPVRPMTYPNHLPVSLDVFGCEQGKADTLYVDHKEFYRFYNLGVVDFSDICVILSLANHTVGNRPATDVHWGMQQTVDYYREKHGYDSFDGKGTRIYSFVNLPGTFADADNATAIPYENAFAGFMTFGYGQQELRPVVKLEVIGHEFTHLVARDLGGWDEEGALNESFADFMGLSVYRHALGEEIWSMGDGLMFAERPMRCLDHPEQYGDPTCYKDDNWHDPEDLENFEVHSECAVQGHMFYLLCTGGEGTNSLGQEYSVTAMDRDEVEALTFKVLQGYLFSGMTYPQSRDAFLQAAADKFGPESAQLQSVRQAWAAVGLGEESEGIEQVRCEARPATLRRYNLQGQPVGDDFRGLVVFGR